MMTVPVQRPLRACLLIARMTFLPAALRPVAAADDDRFQPDAAREHLTWPREFEDHGTRVTLDQPQVEKWEGTDFESRAAVAVTPPGAAAPAYGVAWFRARADV